jgi:hypothetical protein
MIDPRRIIRALDEYMTKENKECITPPEGNEYLASIGLLSNYDRSGSQLRELCRNGHIPQAIQPGGRGTKWVIYHSDMRGFILSSKLEKIISQSKGERAAAAFLAKHPEILRWTVCKTGGHCNYVLKEFPFGSRHKADFVVVTCYSGAWEVHLIELEPPNDMVITKSGVPSKRLNGAFAQVNDWKEYISQNSVAFRQDLAKWCIKRDLLGDCKSVKNPVNGTGHYLSAPDTFIYFNYHIAIGNRSSIDDERRRRINQLNYQGDYKTGIFTYGRFVDVAKNFDRVRHGEQGIRITQSDEE